MSDITTNIPARIYDLGNMYRDLSEEFTIVRKATNSLLSMVSEKFHIDPYGDDKKYEWTEDVQEFENDTLNNGTPVLAAHTTFVVSHIERFAINMVIKFKDYTETMQVVSIDTASSTLTVTRDLNGAGSPTTVADKSVIDIINRPVVEYSRANENRIFEPGTEYNYFELFREDVPFTEIVARSRKLGFKTPEAYIDYNIKRWMEYILNRLEKTMVWGTRYVGTASIPSRMHGIYSFLTSSDTNDIDASGGALSADLINELLKDIYLDDVNASRNIILYMDPTQARKMATFNTSVANRMETVDFNSNLAGGPTSKTLFVGDLQATGTPQIVVDPRAQAGIVMALDMSKISIMYGPDGQLSEWDTKTNDVPRNAVRRGLYMSATLEMKDHKYSHGMISDLKKTL